MATSPIFIGSAKNGKVQIVNADSTNWKTVYTAASSGSKITSLIAASDDTAAHDIQISIANGGTNYLLGTVAVAIGAGNSGTVPAVNLLDLTKLVGMPIDSDGNPYIFLINGDTLQVKALVAVTAAKTVSVSAISVGDF